MLYVQSETNMQLIFLMISHKKKVRFNNPIEEEHNSLNNAVAPTSTLASHEPFYYAAASNSFTYATTSQVTTST